jgi:hypothetical protein
LGAEGNPEPQHFLQRGNVLIAAAPVDMASGPSLIPAYGGPKALQMVRFLDQEQTEIRLEFAKLKQDHADFDAAINAMIAMGCDPLQVQRMKKKKLAFKDRMRELENRIIPDIIA